MPDVSRSPQDHLPLTVPVFQILMSLADRDLHGYAVIQDIRARTEGEVRLTASTLYAAIKRLLAGGLIEELDERPDPALDDARRRYYRITPFGREVARHEARRLQRLTQMARDKDLLPEFARAGQRKPR